MKITDALLGEHGVIYTLFAHVEDRLTTSETLVEVKQLASTLAAVMLPHAHLEDEILFPALQTHIGSDGPLAVMRSEHDTIKTTLRSVAGMTDLESAQSALISTLSLARQHFGKEEQALFRICKNAISDEELERLGDRWATARRVHVY